MEKSLRYVGIENFTVLRPPINGPWVHTVKISAVSSYLKSGACKTEYLLFCDSDDAVLRDDPKKAIQKPDQRESITTSLRLRSGLTRLQKSMGLLVGILMQVFLWVGLFFCAKF
jgi:hypothetical protein